MNAMMWDGSNEHATKEAPNESQRKKSENEQTFDDSLGDNDGSLTTKEDNTSCLPASQPLTPTNKEEEKPIIISDNIPEIDKKLAPSPPRWRFVNEAKKTAGYSTLAAGTVVHGKSADELGAKYIPPKILFEQKNTDDREIGKLLTRERAKEEQEGLPDEEFPGLPSIDETPIDAAKSFREWDARLQLRPKIGRETVWKDPKETFGYCFDDEDPVNRKGKDVGKITVLTKDSSEELFEGSCMLRKIITKSPTDGTHGGDSNHSIEGGAVTEEAAKTAEPSNESGSFDDVCTPTNDRTASTAIFSNDGRQIRRSAGKPISLHEDHSSIQNQKRKRKRCLLLLFLLLLFAALILGIIFGKRSSSGNEKGAGAILAVAIPPPTTTPSISFSSDPTLSPSNNPSIISSSIPSFTPSMECPVGMTMFSVKIQSNASMRLEEMSVYHNATWSLRDACSGDIIMECLPCPDTSGAATTNSTESFEETILSTGPSSPGPKPVRPIDPNAPRNIFFRGTEASIRGSSFTSSKDDIFLQKAPIHDESKKAGNSFYFSPYNGASSSDYIDTKHGMPKKKSSGARLLQQVFNCIPSGNEYVFEVHQSESADSCCGFTAEEFVVLYDDNTVSGGKFAPLTNVDESNQSTKSPITSMNNRIPEERTYFGERYVPCPSSSPSVWPTSNPSDKPSLFPSTVPSIEPSEEPSSFPSLIPSLKPSRNPSVNPSIPPSTLPSGAPHNSPSVAPSSLPTSLPSLQPSGIPSRRPSQLPSLEPTKGPSVAPTSYPTNAPTSSPTTYPPTQGPVIFLGGCPASFVPLSYYTIGTLIELDGIVYECTSFSCGSYGFEPGSKISSLWREAWDIVGSCIGSLTPTTSPTSSPTKIPTKMPSISPNINPSTDPSSSPSVGLSVNPSISPSVFPSEYPSISPTTNHPTQSPVIFLGGCPASFVPLGDYSLGTQVESQGLVYECISRSCGLSDFEPGSENGSLWRDAWKIIGSCQGTKTSTPKPTLEPIPSPIFRPALKPTSLPTETPTRQLATSRPSCISSDNEFNLCIAIDMSGSVCNRGTGSECLSCLPFSKCYSLGVALDLCCSDFSSLIQFSKLMVASFGEIPSDQAFSVVQFASEATLVSPLNSGKQTTDVLDLISYSGGLTNHAEAVTECQISLEFHSSSNRKNLMMIVTDGNPTAPQSDPQGAALAAAIDAKDAGTFIIPVLISPETTLMSTIEFLSGISSDGHVFNVTDFDSLSSLKDRLLERVLCQT